MATIIKRKTKKGLSYTAQIRLRVDGENYTESKTSDDKKFLKFWAEKREHELRQPGAISHAKSSGVNIGEVLSWYKADFGQVREFGRTKLSAIDQLINTPSFSRLDALNLTSRQLLDHARMRRETVSAATLNNDFVWLSNAMRAIRISRGLELNTQAVDDAVFILRREGHIGRPEQRERRPTIGELDKLMELFSDRDCRSKIPMSEVVLFAVFSARRQDEICRILWADLDERRKGVLVRQMKHPRRKIDTFVHLPDRAWSIVKRQEKTDDRIFPYNGKSISAAFTRTCSILGIKDLRFHDLRHEGVSHLFELGWDIPRVARVSGHKSWATLQRYTHVSEHGAFDKYESWKWLTEEP